MENPYMNFLHSALSCKGTAKLMAVQNGSTAFVSLRLQGAPLPLQRCQQRTEARAPPAGLDADGGRGLIAPLLGKLRRRLPPVWRGGGGDGHQCIYHGNRLIFFLMSYNNAGAWSWHQ
jgi:hypothetical protein